MDATAQDRHRSTLLHRALFWRLCTFFWGMAQMQQHWTWLGRLLSIWHQRGAVRKSWCHRAGSTPPKFTTWTMQGPTTFVCSLVSKYTLITLHTMCTQTPSSPVQVQTLEEPEPDPKSSSMRFRFRVQEKLRTRPKVWF